MEDLIWNNKSHSDSSRAIEEPSVLTARAALETTKLLSERIDRLENDFKDQKCGTMGVITGVLIAGFLILITVAIEVIIFHSGSTTDLPQEHTQEQP